MALRIKPLQSLRGKVATDFVRKSRQVDLGISEIEIKEIQDRLWAAIKYFGEQKDSEQEPKQIKI